MRSYRTTIVVLAAVCCLLTATVCESAQAVKPEKSPIVAKCKADLAKRLKLEPSSIETAQAQAVTWPDAALGMPEMGKVYAQAQTPGSRVILQAQNEKYLYTTSAKAYKYGGPVPAWSYSMLYIQPVKNDPNLNGDLYQCSLIGTNSCRFASAVTDCYPQQKGLVIFKRRTSRSGHDLLCVKADKPEIEHMLYHGMDFGDAAVNDAQDKWAGFVKPGLGVYWNVVVNGVSEDRSKAQTISLPDDIRPGMIAWSGEKLMILVDKDGRKVAFETNPKDSASEWKPVSAYTFPGMDAYTLNKSESLEINQVDENGKQVVEVVRAWFTGDHVPVAKIDGLVMRGQELLGPYAFIWGEKDSKPAAYAVDIRTGDTVSCFPGVSLSIRPFAFPPHNSPIIARN